MVLNVIWVGFFLIAFAVGLFKLVVLGDVEVFSRMIESTFDMAKTSFEICLQLAGVLTLWLGIMKVGERAGAVALLAKLVRPFFRRLFPEVPADHPVHGAMILNFSANMLGLDHAAPPSGLQALHQPLDDVARNHASGGVGGRVQDDEPGIRVDQLEYGIRVERFLRQYDAIIE